MMKTDIIILIFRLFYIIRYILNLCITDKHSSQNAKDKNEKNARWIRYNMYIAILLIYSTVVY